MIRVLLGVFLFVFAASAHAETPKLKVIVNAKGPFDALKRSDVEAIFLKKLTRVKDVTVVPFDQPVDAPIRQRFSEAMLQRSPRAVHAYWQQRLFSGQGVPPRDLRDDGAAIAAVAATPGGVAYVAVETALPDSVKAISVAE